MKTKVIFLSFSIKKAMKITTEKVGALGFEPKTLGLKVRCSTN